MQVPGNSTAKEDYLTTSLLSRATNLVMEDDLQHMVLETGDLPDELKGYQIVRESGLDNETMAKFGFATATEERFREAGRIFGYVREFGAKAGSSQANKPVVGTVAHLFKSPESVHGWMQDVFLKEFENNVGEDVGDGQTLVSVLRLEPTGFFDEAVALKAVQTGKDDMVSSTVVDFRVGRVLGVVFIGSPGDEENLDLATRVGISLEKRIVKVVLRGA